jgi:two-component system sensor histidine kinase ArlS
MKRFLTFPGMQIRYKIAAQFTLLVALILLTFSLIVYLLAENQRSRNFYDRLARRATTTARLLVDVKEFSPTLLKIIDRNSSSRLPEEEIYVYNYKNELLYSNVEESRDFITQSLIDDIRLTQKVMFSNDGKEVVGLLFAGRFDRFVVIASAADVVGDAQMKNLSQTLLFGFLGGILITIVLGIFFAGQSLKPIQAINNEIAHIQPQDLRKRVDEGNGQDEIAQLAINFNQMLARLELGFEQQKQFVSHASHELRTPLAALKTEVQVGLEDSHSEKEYKQILHNVLNDTDRLIQLSNALLQLARTLTTAGEFVFTSVRMEEVLLNAQQSVQNSNSAYHIHFDFEQIPEDDRQTLVNGVESLLTNVVVNLLENACKYSPDHQAELRLGFDQECCIIKIKDQGIGISEADLPHIFQPFYRAGNALDHAGFGVGLSVAQRIVQLHNGTIEVKSELEKGTEFMIKLPHQ